MDWYNFIQICIALVAILGILVAAWYGVSQKTTIATLKESNEAYVERNKQLEEALTELKKNYAEKFAELNGRIKTLERIKTPPLKPLIELVHKNHQEVMQQLKVKVNA